MLKQLELFGMYTLLFLSYFVIDKQSSILRRLVFSRASTATQLHNFIQHNIQHRQGFVYGARDGKYLEVSLHGS